MQKNPRSSRKPSVHCPVDEIMRLERTGIRCAEIAERLDISESSVYRIVIRERRKAGLASPAHRKADKLTLCLAMILRAGATYALFA
jgi:DNA-binding NarL/FixJ family response regulator